jgi:alpha-glucosidase
MLTLLASVLVPITALTDVQRKKFTTPHAYLVVEVLDDDLIHFELSAIGPGPSESDQLYTSPMIFKTDYPGASTFNQNANAIETRDIRLVIDQQSLCVEVHDKNKANAKLTKFCPANLKEAFKGLNIDRNAINQVYGLGQQFRTLGDANDDWIAHGGREGDSGLGNGFPGFDGAAVGNVQIPVYYGVGDNNLNYAVLPIPSPNSESGQKWGESEKSTD